MIFLFEVAGLLSEGNSGLCMLLLIIVQYSVHKLLKFFNFFPFYASLRFSELDHRLKTKKYTENWLKMVLFL